MEPKMLRAEKNINPETGFLCRYVKSNAEHFKPNNHDYCELFLVLKGNISHTVNSHSQVLHEGQLLFIRDFDVHDYKSADGYYFEIISLAFKKEYLQNVFNYLGDGFNHRELMENSFPPAVKLSAAKKKKLFYSLTELNCPQNAEYLNAKFKILLLDVFFSYFHNYSVTPTAIPAWLEATYEQMKNPKNFIEGLDKMCEISNKTYAHLARSFKKYYNITPTEFITNLRLEYAATLLSNSNLLITEIGSSCGFENISWFYKMFEKKYGKAPGKYRKDSNLNSVFIAPSYPPPAK